MADRSSSDCCDPSAFLRDEGPREFASRVAAKAHTVLRKDRPELLVDLDDAASVDWTEPGEQLRDPIRVSEGSPTAHREAETAKAHRG